MKKTKILLLLLALALGGGSSPKVRASSLSSSQSGKYLHLQRELNLLADSYIGTGINPHGKLKYPSAVISVVTPDTSEILSYGKLPDGTPPTKKDLYPISSISKMITGLIASGGVVEKDFSLTTSLKSMINAPLSKGLRTETLGMSLTHFASFRGFPLNLSVNAQSEHAPAEKYDYTSLEKALLRDSSSRLPFSPGSKYVYSSLGTALVGLALMDFYKIPRGEKIPFAQSLDALLQRDSGFIKEYGLKSTRAFSLENNDSTNLQIVRGYTSENVSVPAADMGVLGAAGSILSNGEDMLKLLEMLLRPQGKWAQVVAEATRPLKALEGTSDSIGYSIDIKSRQGMTLLTKAGTQAGFSSLIIWNKETGVGFVALTNRGDDSKSLAQMLISAHLKAKEIYAKSPSP